MFVYITQIVPFLCRSKADFPVSTCPCLYCLCIFVWLSVSDCVSKSSSTTHWHDFILLFSSYHLFFFPTSLFVPALGNTVKLIVRLDAPYYHILLFTYRIPLSTKRCQYGLGQFHQNNKSSETNNQSHASIFPPGLQLSHLQMWQGLF